MASSEQPSGGGGGPRISRRTLARGVAWTTPVVMMGVPVPAFAASGCCVNPAWTTAAYSGAGGAWTLAFTFENCGTQPLRLTMLEVLIMCNGVGAYQTVYTESGKLSTINAGATVTYSTGKTKWAAPNTCWADDAGRRCHYEPATNEKQRITRTGAVTTFTLTFNGQTTANISGDATAAAVQAALEALSNIAPGDVVVTGGALSVSPITVEFTGAYALTNVNQMSAADVGAGSVTVTTRVGGGPCDNVECQPVVAYPGWAGHRPCEVLLQDKTKVRLTFVSTSGGACTLVKEIPFSTSQLCGTTAGCATFRDLA